MLFYLDKTGQNVRFFEEVLFFQATYNRKTEKQTINSCSLCHFDAGMLAEGKCHGRAGEEEELAKFVERLDKASTAYGMEISAEKTNLMKTAPVASAQRSK